MKGLTIATEENPGLQERPYIVLSYLNEWTVIRRLAVLDAGRTRWYTRERLDRHGKVLLYRIIQNGSHSVLKFCREPEGAAGLPKTRLEAKVDAEDTINWAASRH